MSHARISEIERRLCNMVQPGTVVATDYAKARLKVKVGKNETAWIPWLTGRAGGDRTWSAPEAGEQVLVLSPSGDMAQGYAVPSVYRKDYPANADSGDVSRTTYKDGAVVEYDRAAHAHKVSIPAGGNALVKVGSNASVTLTSDSLLLQLGGLTVTVTPSGIAIVGNVTVSGSINTTGDVVAQSISLKNHTHSDPQGGTVGAPQ